MNNKYRIVRVALILLSGVTIMAGLMLTGVACKTTAAGGKPGAGVAGTSGQESPYRLVAFDHEQHKAAADNDCSICHHQKPNAAKKACHKCHNRDEGRFSKKFAAFVPKLKEAMHDPDSGCRGCHDETTEDGLWDCSQCHAS